MTSNYSTSNYISDFREFFIRLENLRLTPIDGTTIDDWRYLLAAFDPNEEPADRLWTRVHNSPGHSLVFTREEYDAELSKYDITMSATQQERFNWGCNGLAAIFIGGQTKRNISPNWPESAGHTLAFLSKTEAEKWWFANPDGVMYVKQGVWATGSAPTPADGSNNSIKGTVDKNSIIGNPNENGAFNYKVATGSPYGKLVYYGMNHTCYYPNSALIDPALWEAQRVGLTTTDPTPAGPTYPAQIWLFTAGHDLRVPRAREF